jgi:putative endonuclease
LESIFRIVRKAKGAEEGTPQQIKKGTGRRTPQQIAGAAGEAKAQAYLEEAGLCLVARNVRYRDGELDLVMQAGEMLVFVEVRQRRTTQFGGAAASVTPAKQQRLWQAAQRFLLDNPAWQRAPCRFDVIAIDGANQDARINWLQNAF